MAAAARRIPSASTAQPVLPNEILEYIFLRLDAAADLARTSAACSSFRRLISARRFLRRVRSVTSLKFGGMLINKNVDLQFLMNHWSACQLEIRMSSISLSFNS
jgi:hypothetical protein